MPTLVSHPDEVKVISRRFGQGAADIEKYIELDGYKAVQMAIAEGPEWIVNTMKASGLRGRGGAGFPTGMKWSFVPKVSEKPKYVLVNGDESEPGTCKDHVIFLHDPHAVIEGTMIAGLAIGAKMGFIYLRGENKTKLNEVEVIATLRIASPAGFMISRFTRSADNSGSTTTSARATGPAAGRHRRPQATPRTSRIDQGREDIVVSAFQDAHRTGAPQRRVLRAPPATWARPRTPPGRQAAYNSTGLRSNKVRQTVPLLRRAAGSTCAAAASARTKTCRPHHLAAPRHHARSASLTHTADEIAFNW